MIDHDIFFVFLNESGKSALMMRRIIGPVLPKHETFLDRFDGAPLPRFTSGHEIFRVERENCF